VNGRHSRGGNNENNPGGSNEGGNDPRETEQLLADALQAHAQASVGDDRLPPAPRFETHPGAMVTTHGGRRRWLAPLAAAAAVVAVVGGAAGLTAALSGNDNQHRDAAHQQTGGSVSPTNTRPAAAGSGAQSGTKSTSAVPTVPVRVSTLNADGASYGVGMPVVAFFSRKITNGAALQHATTVTVNGKTAHGAWYFEPSSAGKGPIEGHFRLQHYWPAHSNVTVRMPVAGRSAGPGMAFANNISVQFRTGAANISVVNDQTHMMTVTSDGKLFARYPVSLGADKTPTARGIKVIMEKGRSICMHGPGYDECGIKWTQRLTYGGEYLHSAPWNIANIKGGTDTSNGCTNLMPADAQRLYDKSEIGDVVQYPNASGPQMQLGSGYGDWNVLWSTWQGGGAVPTS
jgi:lipoprotein-anchoring transpeptidase ErfK/SrfK